MKTLKNLFFTMLLLVSMIWVITQGDTTDAGKIIRLIALITSICLWSNYTDWAKRLMDKFLGL